MRQFDNEGKDKYAVRFAKARENFNNCQYLSLSHNKLNTTERYN